MKTYGPSRQEKVTGSLIHDHRNNMDNFDFHINKMAEWLKDNVKALTAAGIPTSIPYVAIEYFKRDVQRKKAAIDAFYIEFSNDFNEPANDAAEKV